MYPQVFLLYNTFLCWSLFPPWMGGVAGSDVRPRPRPSPDMVTACCIARKGNFRHGPSLHQMEALSLPEGYMDIASEDETMLPQATAQTSFGKFRQHFGKKVKWRPDRFLEDRYEILESGDEWTNARRSEDINFADLPEVGIARKMTFHKDAGNSARQRVARRKGHAAEPDPSNASKVEACLPETLKSQASQGWRMKFQKYSR